MKFLLLSITLTTLLGPLVVPPRTASTPTSDEAAIQTMIERETQAYLDRNATAQANCWASTGDLSQRVGLDDGVAIKIPNPTTPRSSIPITASESGATRPLSRSAR